MKKEFLEILACPNCKGKVFLQERKGKQELVCDICQVAYPIKEGIPVMLFNEARKLK